GRTSGVRGEGRVAGRRTRGGKTFAHEGPGGHGSWLRGGGEGVHQGQERLRGGRRGEGGGPLQEERDRRPDRTGPSGNCVGWGLTGSGCGESGPCERSAEAYDS